MVKSLFENNSTPHIGSGSLLTPLVKSSNARVFIATALHNVANFGHSLMNIKIQFGAYSNHPYFELDASIICHGKEWFPLELYPNEDWAILVLEKTSGQVYDLLMDCHHNPLLPVYVIPRPSKVEKTIILNDSKYSMAIFSILQPHFGSMIDTQEWIEVGSMYGSFGYGSRISKQTLLHNMFALSYSCGAMAIRVDFPRNEIMEPFKHQLKVFQRFDKMDAIGIHVGNREDNVLCPATQWFEEYYRIVYPEICEILSDDEKRRINKEVHFMQRLDKYQRCKMIEFFAYHDVKIICGS